MAWLKSEPPPHTLEPIDDHRVHNTYRCTRCDVILSGLTKRDRINLQTPGLGKCELPLAP